MRNRVLILPDSLIADDVFERDKDLALTDLLLTTDCLSIDKVLSVTEGINIIEVITGGAGGSKKTRLFLMLGDFALELTGS